MGNGGARRRGTGRQGFHVVKNDEGALPSDVEAERAVVSLCFQAPDDALPRAMRTGLRLEALTVPAHRMLFALLVELHGRGEVVDLQAVTRVLRDRGELDNAGGEAGVAAVFTAESSGWLLEDRCSRVLAAGAKRKLWLAGEKAKEAAGDPSSEVADQLAVLQAQMREMLEANPDRGVVVPIDGEKRPRLNVGQPVQELARELGAVLGKCGFYRMAETRRVVTVDDAGHVEPVTEHRLVGSIGKHVYPVEYDRQREREVSRDIGVTKAKVLLETDTFLKRLPELRSVAPVRVPVMKGGQVVLAKKGYDEETQVFCADQIPYDAGMNVDDAVEVLEGLLKGFEFPEASSWKESRSGLLQVGVMLASYCHLLLPPGTPRPMVVYVANQPGSGKTLLASMALLHVFGAVASEDFPVGKGGQEELKKILDVAAIEQKGVLWFDDAPEFVQSHALNRFVTASRHNPRVLGKSQKMDVAAQTQVFLTGNHIRVTRDLIRRAVVIELFVPGDIETREFELELTQPYLAREETRKSVLAACWSLVREWVDAGAKRREHTPLKGFADWCGLVGGLVGSERWAGVDPLEVPDLPMSGDEETMEMKRLLVAVAEEWGEPEEVVDVTLDHIVEVARREQVTLCDRGGRDIIGNGTDTLDGPARRSLGMKLKKWRGRQLVDGKGKAFTFGKRHQERGAVYPLTYVG